MHRPALRSGRLASHLLRLAGFAAAVALSFAIPAKAQLLLTEVQSNQAASGVNDYWELTNTGAAAVDLTGWRWNDNARTVTGAIVIPSGTSIAAGESVIFTAVSASTFRAWWGISSTVQVISTGSAPGLGSGDGVSLFNAANEEVFFFSYAANGFARSDGTLNSTGHAGVAGGGTQTQALVLDPRFGVASPRYTAATAGTYKAFASATAAADIGSPGVSGLVREVGLSMYVRVGRYNLPEPTRTSAPAGNLLCQEASAVTYNWDTDTLFITGDGGRSITQVSKIGVLIDTMTLPPGGSPQGTEFYDPEGITYVGNNQFVFSEERDRQLVLFTYAAGTTLSRSGAKTVKIGTFVNNTGTEGLSWDPQTGGFICLKEIDPIGIFQTNVNFDAGTATNGSPTTANSVNLFDPALLGMLDVADVFALSNIPALEGRPQAGNLIVLSQESANMVNVDRSGNILSSLTIVADPGDTLTSPAMQHEGVTMDREGNIYVVNENAGGNADYPQLWVYAPSSVPNQAPTAVALVNAVTSLPENTNTGTRVKVADIAVADDGLGTNTLTLSGADAGAFEVIANALYIKAGTVLDYETKITYSVTIAVDDVSLGTAPDATVDYTLTLIDVENETPSLPAIIISEIAPWSSGNSLNVAADWFELTNTSDFAVDITGWKIDDDSASFGNAIALTGITSIGPGESVIFIETSDLPGRAAAFKSNWFGGNPPAGLQIGAYSGSGIGLSTGGDALNVYNSSGELQANVTFGASPGGPYPTFNNAAGLNGANITTMSVVGVNGAFAAVNASAEIGSPGTVGRLFVSEVAPWSSGNGPVGADWFEVTNSTAHAVDITGWKMDDDSQSFAAATPLTGIATIAPGESVIFLETGDLATKSALFKSTWFGDNPPAGLQIGAFAGIGLSTTSDQVNLYNAGGVLKATVIFGASSTGVLRTFDNTVGLNNVTISQLSVAGTNGAFAAVADANSVGSPGTATLASPEISLSLNVSPATFSESAANPAATGTVTRTGSTTNSLVVSLASSDETETTVPATVTIPAGSASADFSVTAVDDVIPDGDKQGTITATAGGAVAGTFIVTVTDDGDVAAPIKLLLTEVQSNQAAAGTNDYWELTNVGTESVSLGNWKWTDSARTVAGAITIPAGTAIAAGESIIFTGLSASAFRTWWGIGSGVQVISNASAPGLGMNDGITLFDDGGSEVFFFSYGSAGFIRSSGSPAAGGHAGSSGGGTATMALVLDPAFGTDTPRYTAAVVGSFGAFASAANAADIGSPGATGLTTSSEVALTVTVTPATFSESATNPAATATVTRSGATTADLIVSLSSSDTTEATVPATVTISAGQASATFNVNAVDDAFPDANKTVTITASATDVTPGAFDITVNDDGDVLNTNLMLTEVQSNQSAGAPAGVNDYWELTNFGAETVDLTGYSWHDSGRSAAAAAAYKLTSGSSIAAGESVIFTVAAPAAFRTWWGLDASVKVFQTLGAPGLGQNDGVSFFDNGGNELFFFSYAANGFTREDGAPSTGTHAGPSAGASADSVAVIWAPPSGTATPRYTFATGGNHGSFAAAVGSDLGSPGVTQAPATAGVIAFSSAVYSVNQGATSVTLTLTRSGGTLPCSVNLQTENGAVSTVPPFAAALAGVDYIPVLGADATVTFGAGETTRTVEVTLIPNTPASTPNKRFTAILSDPAGGATLGGETAASVQILAHDTTLPTLTLTSPSPGSVSLAWPLVVKGVAGDARGVAAVEVALNGGAWQAATLGEAKKSTSQPFSLPITPGDGWNIIAVRVTDLSGNSGTVVYGFHFTRRYVVSISREVPAEIAATPDKAGAVAVVATPSTASSVLTATPASADPKTYQIVPGATVKLTAQPKTGYTFHSWSGLPEGAVVLGNVATFQMPVDDAAITARFVPNPFSAPPGSGTGFYGLIHAEEGTVASNDTEGFVYGAMAASGAFSGKVLIGGLTQSFSAVFFGDGAAVFTVGKAKQTSLTFGSRVLQLFYNAGDGNNRVTAQITDGSAVSVGVAGRLAYTAANPVPATIYNSTSKGFFTVSLPSIAQNPERAAHLYPQGDGHLVLTVKPAGTFTFTGLLADGSAVTGSSGIVAGDSAPVFSQLTTPGAKSTVKGGSVGGQLVFADLPDSDVSGQDLLWFRPAVTALASPAAAAAATNLYTEGWPEGLRLDAVGALYDKTLAVQSALELGAADPVIGNGSLVLVDGKLTEPIVKTSFNINGNTVTKTAPADSSYSLSLSAGSGVFSGSFLPNWSPLSTAKPAFKGILLQKGGNRAGFGFFISNAKDDADPESGGVTLSAPEQ